MLLSLVPSFNFWLSRVSIDQFTIVENMPGKNMAFGRSRYVAFPFHWVRQCFCWKKRMKSCIWVTLHVTLKSLSVWPVFLSFWAQIPSHPLISFFYLCPYYTVEPPHVSVIFLDIGQNGSVSQMMMVHCFVKYHMYERISEATKGS